MSKNILSEEEQILIFKYNQKNITDYCPNCKVKVLNYDDYCYNCGLKLNFFQENNNENHTRRYVDKELLLKYAAVSLLLEISVDSFLFCQKIHSFSYYKQSRLNEILLKFKPLNAYDVRDYLLSKGYISNSKRKIDQIFRMADDDFLEMIISEHYLEPGSSKEENISILLENISQDELKQITSKYYEITDKGKIFIDNNMHCICYNDMFYDFDLNYYDYYFNKNNNLKEFLLEIINDSLIDSIKECKWQSYSNLLFKYAQFYDYLDNVNEMLYYTIQHFICEINPYNNENHESKIEIPISLKDKLIYALSKSNPTYDEFLKITSKAYDETKLPENHISKKDIELLIEELIDDKTELRLINKHLIEIYNLNKLNNNS